MAALVLAAATPLRAQLNWGPQIIEPGLTKARLRALATATRTEQAGWQLPEERGQVYVPPQCVGTRRCPLVFVFGGISPEPMLAEKYGFIMSPPRPLAPLLSTLAIDPDKIALWGKCHGMPWAIENAAKGFDAINRVVIMNGALPPAMGLVPPPNGATEFYVEHSLRDGAMPTLVTAHQLRRAGHPVTVAINGRGHIGQVESYDAVGQWLTESWAMPNSAGRPTRPAPVDTVPEVELTEEALRKMIGFWTLYREAVKDQEKVYPNYFTTIRMAHQRRVAVPYPDSAIRPWAQIMDTPTLAAKFPLFAETLRRAGLTAQEHDEYRIALYNAYAAWGEWRTNKLAVLATSVLGKNVAFIDTHPDEMIALEDTGMWRTP